MTNHASMMFQFQKNFDGHIDRKSVNNHAFPVDQGPRPFGARMRQRERSERKPCKSHAFCAAYLKKRQGRTFSGSIR
jgi:hypothetical protein